MNETRPRSRVAWVIVPFCAISFIAGRFSAPHPPAQFTAAGEPVPTSPAIITAAPIVNSEPGQILLPEKNKTSLRTDLSWEQLLAAPASPARDRDLAAWLETLAATDPQRALALAQAEKNLRTRETLLNGALRGWGGSAPQDAASWALALTDSTVRSAAIISVFNGAVAKPTEALGIIQKLAAGNSDEATDCGLALINALSDRGDFSNALHIVNYNVGDAQRSILAADAYSRWATFQPEQAAQFAASLTDPTARNEALHGVVGGWAQSNPEGLTRFIADLPANSDRAELLGQSLTSWARLDPISVANWIIERGGSPELDEGIAAVASVNFVKHDLALDWAEAITDAKLRSDTIANVLHGWVLEDPAGAKQYLAATKNLLPEDRKRINEIIVTGEQAQQAQR